MMASLNILYIVSPVVVHLYIYRLIYFSLKFMLQMIDIVCTNRLYLLRIKESQLWTCTREVGMSYLRMFSVVSLLSGMFFMACSSIHEIRNTGEIDDTWAGLWKGKMLIEDSLNPPKEVLLEIEFTSTHIRGFYTDSLETVYRQKVKRLRIEGDQIQFQVAYETKRGLRALIDFAGRRFGQHMMVEFWGSEGGKSFRGKWEARLTRDAARPSAVRPATLNTEGVE